MPYVGVTDDFKEATIVLPDKYLALLFFEDQGASECLFGGPWEDSPDRHFLQQILWDGEDRPCPGIIETAVLVGPVLLV